MPTVEKPSCSVVAASARCQRARTRITVTLSAPPCPARPAPDDRRIPARTARRAPRIAAIERVGDFLGQPVAAQQELHARVELAVRAADAHRLRIGDAERLRDDVAVRMAARLLAGDRALVDQLLHVGVILRELLQSVVPDVDAAVADPGDFEIALAADAQRGDRRAHRQRFGARASNGG